MNSIYLSLNNKRSKWGPSSAIVFVLMIDKSFITSSTIILAKQTNIN